MKLTLPLLALSALSLSTSCSLLAPSVQLVSITASDPSAEILVDGTLQGTGAVSLQLRRSEDHTILARVGERYGMARIETTISSTGVLDVIGGILFLVPLVGMASPGFYDLDRTSVTLVIPPPTQVSTEAERSDLPGTRASGTGFFVSSEGHIVTNYHVIEGWESIQVYTHDGREFAASLLRSDRDNDLAVLTIKTSSQPLPLAQAARKGDEICVIGYPLPEIQGFEQKTTFGRVNSLTGLQGDARYIQMDCPIQPGNSGGPVINKYGHVIGVATSRLDALAILEETGSLPQNVNYAVRSIHMEKLLEGLPRTQTTLAGAHEFADIVQDCEPSVVQIIVRSGG